MGGVCLALAVTAVNSAVLAVIFCMAVSATSETCEGLLVFLVWPFPLPEVCLCSDLTPLFGTILLLGGGFSKGVCHVCPPSGFGTGVG